MCGSVIFSRCRLQCVFVFVCCSVFLVFKKKKKLGGGGGGGGVAVRCVRRVTIYYVCSLVLGEMAVFVLGSCSNNANQ